MNQKSPTPQETLALKRIQGVPMRSPLTVLAISALLLSLQSLPERYAAVSAFVSVGLALCVVAVLVYQACFLRCPRCYGWIAIPKCPDCGLRLEEPANPRRSEHV
jgi:hypothetical protein